MTHPLTVEVPAELAALLGPPETAAAKVVEVLALKLLGEGHLSQGQAAELLGLTRWDLLDLMAMHGVPSGPETAEEMRRDIEVAERFTRRS